MTVTLDREPDEVTQRPRRRLRAGLALTLGVVVLAGAGAGYWLLVHDTAPEAATEPTGPVATAEVTLTTISRTETWDGTLGNGTPFVVTASSEGTVTRVAAQESAVTRGTELYRLDEKPVIAMTGTIPMYRDLGQGDTGADVEQLEANLTALGYDGYDVDDEFTWYTAQAVAQWQEDIGADETGTVAVSDVVFLPMDGRVSWVGLPVGAVAQPGSEVLEIAGTDQIVDFEAEVGERDLVPVGSTVTVRLAGGVEVAGTVTSSAVVAGESESPDDSPDPEDAVVEVQVTLAEIVDESLVGSPVDVVVPVDTRENVLVVPVNALLTLAAGGFGLEVVAADGSTSIVPVEAGLFANGMVEVSGDGIAEGTVVGVAGR